jgi:ribokinase
MTSRVIVVGSLNVDIVVSVPRMPDSGETVFGTGVEQHAGGKGLNQAVAAARLGASVTMIGAVGHDAGAGFLRQIVTQESIDERFIATSVGPSGTALIEVDDSGANRIVVVPGANASVTAEAVSAAIAHVGEAAVVLVQGEVPVTAIEAAMRSGRAIGARTILNPAPVFDLDHSMLSLVDVLIPNEHEAALLTGLPVDSTVDATEAAQALVSRGVGCVVITRGSRGSVWATAQGSGSFGVFAVTPIDTVSAGESFCGGYAAALAEGRDFIEALRWASAAGALSTTMRGAVPSLPRRSAVEELLAQA